LGLTHFARLSSKLRFENISNKKTLKQAWRFFLLKYVFVTSTVDSSNFIEDLKNILSFDF